MFCSDFTVTYNRPNFEVMFSHLLVEYGHFHLFMSIWWLQEYYQNPFLNFRNGKCLKTSGKGITVHECTICEKVFTYRSLWTRHLKSHSTDNSFKCHVCQKVWTITLLSCCSLYYDSNAKPYSLVYQEQYCVLSNVVMIVVLLNSCQIEVWTFGIF